MRLVKKIAASFGEAGQIQPKPGGTLLDVREIAKILPHRFPFLLIDKVIEMDGYQRAVGIKNVSFNEPFFQGHFPGQPIMPGVLQIEAMAQLAGVLFMRKSENQAKVAVLLSLDGVKLRKSVVPGDQLRLEVETIKIKARTGEVFARATVDGQLVAEANMKFMLMDG
jgi:UDP-3-O-[3-hydroxymyristoyl] N-acetylglucosamine deacetylase/3-hydroxyacyl-[acyl-carrier-protein] dehydratase